MVFFPDNFFPLLFVWSFSDWTEIREKMQGIAKFRANRLFCGREMMNNYLSMVNKIFHYRFSLLWFVSWKCSSLNDETLPALWSKKKQERNIKSMFIAHQYLTLVVSFSFRCKANTSSVNNTSRTKKKKEKDKNIVYPKNLAKRISICTTNGIAV